MVNTLGIQAGPMGLSNSNITEMHVAHEEQVSSIPQGYDVLFQNDLNNCHITNRWFKVNNDQDVTK